MLKNGGNCPYFISLSIATENENAKKISSDQQIATELAENNEAKEAEEQQAETEEITKLQDLIKLTKNCRHQDHEQMLAVKKWLQLFGGAVYPSIFLLWPIQKNSQYEYDINMKDNLKIGF